MLEQLSSVAFKPHLHQMFTVQLPNVAPIALELADVSELGNVSIAGGSARQPFSLLFLGPISRQYLQQHIYQLVHAQMGAIDLFLVPLGLEDGRMRYEAIFT